MLTHRLGPQDASAGADEGDTLALVFPSQDSGPGQRVTAPHAGRPQDRLAGLPQEPVLWGALMALRTPCGQVQRCTLPSGSLRFFFFF